MKKSEKTLKHLRKFKLLLEENIHTERMFRLHLIKKYQDDDFEGFISANSDTFKEFVGSMSYQRFLEKMLKDVFDDITL